MKLSEHAKSKLEIYNVPGYEIIEACDKPIYELYDENEEARIKIIKIEEVIFAVVFNKKTQTIITVYRTDIKTINNRLKNKRWI
ncbi:MAG: hypothetical protein COX07_00505 [Bacteroidetes bacterium CG23_combo_of_CG06-09_8_20_14_all_32_9]|nr:MAG: hypothetical protein COX07_00505 [Bacteroidetes bacterium CG23_combo_of_CG06-09_8_20_14_all_32_9]